MSSESLQVKSNAEFKAKSKAKKSKKNPSDVFQAYRMYTYDF